MIDILSTLLLGLGSDRAGAGIGAAFEKLQKDREALGAFQNEHIERAVRRAALRATKACIEQAVEEAGGASKLITPLKEGRFRPDWAAGQSGYYPADKAIEKINTEIKELYHSTTPGALKQPFLRSQDVIRAALDGFPNVKGSKAVSSIVSAMCNETIASGEWDGEPDGLRAVFESEENGFLHHLKEAIHREIKDPNAPEFGKIYNILSLRQIETGVAGLAKSNTKLEKKTDSIIEAVEAIGEQVHTDRIIQAREAIRRERRELGQRSTFERQSLPLVTRNRAKETLNTALLQAPEDPVVLVFGSDLERWDGDAKKALEYSDKAIKTNPEDVEAWLTRGAAQQRLALGPETALNDTNSVDTELLNKALASFEKATSMDKRNAATHLYKGLALHYLNRSNDALDCFDKAIELDSSLIHAYQSKAYVLTKNGNTDSALRTIQTASELFPNDADTWSYYGWIAGPTDQRTALDCYERALAIRPLSPNAWIGKGTELGNLDRNEEALAALEKAITLNPNSALAWTNKGWVLEKLSRSDDALEAQRKAVSIEPELAEAWANLGSTLFNLKRRQEALEAFETSLKWRPDDAFVWCEKALVLSKLEQHGEALRALEKSIELDETHALAWSRKATALADLDQFENALSAGAKAVELEPGNAMFWFNHGSTLARMDRFSDAAEAFEQATELDPDDYQGWQYRSRALGQIGRFEESLAVAEKAIVLKTDEALSWNLKGRALGELGRLSEAVKFFQRACSLDSSNEFFWRNLGLTQMGIREFSDALESLKKANDINADDANVMVAMGEAYGNTGDFQNALSSFENAISLGMDNANTWTSVARALGALGKMQASIEASERAIAHDPEHAGAWNNKGVSFEALKKYSDAVHCFEKAIALAPQFEMAHRNRERVIQTMKQLDI
jgi:tetratricopeptide (TPR) repeat protein